MRQEDQQLQATFGTELTETKPEHYIRLCLGNVGGLPVFQKESKSQHFIDQLRHFQVDVFMGTETGWNVHKIDAYNSWKN